MLDMNEYYRTVRIDVTRCPHCAKKFRVSAKRDGRRISSLLSEGKIACCPACRQQFVIRIIPDEAEARRSARQLAREFDRHTREQLGDLRVNGAEDVACEPKRSIAPLQREKSLVPMGGTLAANAIDPWSSYNPQPSKLAADMPASMSVDSHSPHFRWGAWGCGTFILGLMLYLPFAVMLLAFFGPEVGCPLGLLFGFLFAGMLCYRAEKNAPARNFKRDQARREREAKRKATRGENGLERWLRERAEFRRAHPELSYEAYLAERGMGNMSTTGRAVVGWLAMKHLGTVPCLLDFQLWKAEKQGKMKKSTGWAIRLALIDWSRSRRMRREEDERMRRQAEYITEAMTRKNTLR